MSGKVLLTKGDGAINSSVLRGLLERGCTVAVACREGEEADAIVNGLSDCGNRERLVPLFPAAEDEAAIKATVDEAVRRMGGMDYAIHGVDHWDEEEAYDGDAAAFGLRAAASLRSRFLYSRAAAAHMARHKHGHIVFQLIADRFYYAGCASNPVTNSGTITLMRTLAKEMSPFRVGVNAVTFGCYAMPEGQADRKRLKQQLEIHALKPYLPQPDELADASLTWLLHASGQLVSGQNIHFGAGIDTDL
ncbi:SDR family oxidoreductase [Paenibacillus lycopersici]|uniref:SDR family oxidoreductase n=1 Tax=Paenibacillus lycopersici TaxID=2704462 RepID=A0A6C0G0R2_9BACL|nr:SDR family oxidoreductase [Paenibacillus lycopersici]QHT61952.1 SDR family oxidoreductase [Paenibacillus lycopersici]